MFEPLGSHSHKGDWQLYIMMKVSILSVAILGSSFVCRSNAFGEDGHRHHEAHQHGIGELGIVHEGKDLSIVLRAPASDLVGFEHAAQSKEETAAVSSLESVFERSEKLFSLPSEARCKQVDHTLEHGLKKKEDAEVGDVHDHAGKHDSASDSEIGHSEVHHSEISAEYRYYCENPERLNSIRIVLFGNFPSLRRIDASVVTPSYQGKQQLSPASSTLSLSQ